MWPYGTFNDLWNKTANYEKCASLDVITQTRFWDQILDKKRYVRKSEF